MDGMGSKKNVFIIGATNRPDIIDSAIMRWNMHFARFLCWWWSSRSVSSEARARSSLSGAASTKISQSPSLSTFISFSLLKYVIIFIIFVVSEAFEWSWSWLVPRYSSGVCWWWFCLFIGLFVQLCSLISIFEPFFVWLTCLFPQCRFDFLCWFFNGFINNNNFIMYLGWGRINYNPLILWSYWCRWF